MKGLISGSTSIDDAKRAKTDQRMARKNAGFDNANSFITIKQHEQLMAAALGEYDTYKNNEILEYLEYRLSVTGRLVAYKRLWEYRLARVARPFVSALQQYREIQKRKKLRAAARAAGQAVPTVAMRPQEIVEAIEKAQ